MKNQKPKTMLKILTQKKKQWINPKLENECELKRFKAYAVYSRVGHFGYTPL